MAMFGLGASELMVLLLLSSGGNLQDAVSIFPARDYFKMRDIDPTQAKLIELAGTDPTTPKAQIMQLMALRLLAEDTKLDPVVLKVVRDIAEGNRAKDKTGFSQKYAQKVMAAVAGKTDVPLVKAKVTEGLEWFPADATIAGAVDFRLARIPGVAPTVAEPMIWRFLPEKVKREVLQKAFEVLEQTGNIEVYRGSVAVAWNNDKGHPPTFYGRFSGHFNQEWVLKAIQSQTPLKFQPVKDSNGDEYLIGELENTAMSFQGGTELLFAVDDRRAEAGKSAKLIAEMMEVKAGKKDSVLKSKRLKDLFAKVPPNALGLFVMELPEEAKKNFGFIGGKLEAPERIVFHATPALKALDIQLEAMMQNEDHANTTVKGIFGFREMGIQQLKMMEGNVPIRGFTARPFIQLLESLQVEAKGTSVHVRLLLPEDVMRGMVDMMMRIMPAEFGPDAPPPVQKLEKKGAARGSVSRPAA